MPGICPPVPLPVVPQWYGTARGAPSGLHVVVEISGSLRQVPGDQRLYLGSACPNAAADHHGVVGPCRSRVVHGALEASS